MKTLEPNGSGQFSGHWWIYNGGKHKIRIATKNHPEKGYTQSEAQEMLPQVINPCLLGKGTGYHHHSVNLGRKKHIVMIDAYGKVTTPQDIDGNYTRTNDSARIPGYRTLQTALEKQTLNERPKEKVV